ncbi:hypothetical protein FRACYDRAFT_260283 [Fragilariopsis cylindrus CCMP1102]|uniref:BZIP domain-containing protein n=1 Tax=Fragilariopsis cylindrus CCMP1102 TaxID=635003 RepID=A0A1E7FQ25_9STRA|nr:hypothetical protein FRACYDRAFT_260283 [Fragilariopsis cylindrus CCMP1102]|eukprot:OEU20279.1 hypothetical protein FRACYDRAFT_260283 [Fragilariopsis cylindrus CCMP1102]
MMDMHIKNKHVVVADRNNKRGNEKTDGKEHAIHSLLAFSNPTSADAAADETTVITTTSSSTRREDQLLSNRLSARDRRKRQKVSNERMKNENVELKAKLRRKADEMKELKARNENLECGLRQACMDNLTLLTARMPEPNLQLHQERQQQHEHPSQASVLDPLMLLSPAFSNGANSAAMNGNFPVPFNLQRQRSNTMTSAPPSSLIQPFNLQRPRSNTTSSIPSSSLGQQDQSRVDSVIQQEMLQKLLQKLRQH